MTIDEFLSWRADQPDRHELIAGHPAPVPPSRQARSLYITDLIIALRPLAHGQGMRLLHNMQIVCGDDVRYPALIVDSGTFCADAIFPSTPVIVIDVNRDWSALADVRYLTLKTGDDMEALLAASRSIMLQTRGKFRIFAQSL